MRRSKVIRIVAVNVPVNTVAPVIGGTATYGSTLTVTNTGTWTNTPTGFSYQWRRNSLNIGTNVNNYTLVAADVGQTITCVITASNVNGAGLATSNALGPISAGTAPANTVAPAITGSTVVGSTLTCSTGTWTGTTPITYGYQWYRDGVAISGATNSTYTTTTSGTTDVGANISCIVTATNSSSVTASATPVGPITSSSISAPALVFDTSAGWVTGQNPPKMQWTLPSDGTVIVGDYLVRQYSTSSIFASGNVTEYHQITSDDILTGVTSFPFGTALAGGLTYFHGSIGRGTPGSFSAQSAYSTTISDTLSAPAVTDAVIASPVPASTGVTNTNRFTNITFSAGIPCVALVSGGVGNGVGIYNTSGGALIENLTLVAQSPDGVYQLWSGAALGAGTYDVNAGVNSGSVIKIIPCTITNSTNPTPSATSAANQTTHTTPWQVPSSLTATSGSDVIVTVASGDLATIAASFTGTQLSLTESSSYFLGKHTTTAQPGFTGSGTHTVGICAAVFHFS